MTEFIGGSVLITLLYVLMVYFHQLPFTVVVGLSLVILAVTLACCLMLHMGSMSILISCKILKQLRSSNECKYTRKFVRSCKPIEVKIGDFHKIDRQRAPTFIRYVTQRAFAFVMKTKMSPNFEDDQGFTLPL